MQTSTNAIVLSKLKYRDNDLIVKCYTQKHGVVSFLVRGAFKAKKTTNKAAYFQLLSQLQIVFNYSKNKTLYAAKEVRLNAVYQSLQTNVLKGAVVIFLSEILNSTLHEEEKNEELYSFLEASLLWFDVTPASPNFHLLFLLKLTKYLGFYPDTSQSDFENFDLQSGSFQPNNLGKHNVSGENLILLKRLLGTTFDALDSIKINSQKRQHFLNMMLQYFELHLGSFKTPKSLQVFNQVFK
ncbi:MAG: DNA repair protein RecO [Jejuia sp.]